MNEVLLVIAVLAAGVGSYLFALRVLCAVVPALRVSSVFGGVKADAFLFLLLSFFLFCLRVWEELE